MYNILKLNSISSKASEILGTNYSLLDQHPDPDAILVRSCAMTDYAPSPALRAVARAGAGVNNIPIQRMTENGIVVFNTPGANANAVKELVLCGLFLAARDIISGINWVCSQDENDIDLPKRVEKQKGLYAGHEILGKTIGVVGLGAIGIKVANSAEALGLSVLANDPHMPEHARCALKSEITITSLDEILRLSDYITFHVPLVNETRGMINKNLLSKAKPGVTILNMSRAEIANSEDIKSALASGSLKKYIVDFPTPELIKVNGVISIPHLGASTEEAEENCAIMAASQLKDYLETGNISNSVNFPNLAKPLASSNRFAVLYKTGDLCFKSALDTLLLDTTYSLALAEKNEMGYALIDLDLSKLTNSGPLLENLISSINGVVWVQKIF
ncbi:MAG: 3-phosphoglycerate dehydrogenase [Christensenellaceae bacterium]|jgi:D-3-phosphoglycerate dehydrogenase|nr:3-phosphoglycerate dehydrogenase [Christensenellaceae bacterium]